MAGLSSGALTPIIPLPQTSRTRTCHGVFELGDVPCAAFSGRQFGNTTVQLDIGVTSAVVARCTMSSAQAREMARALLAAAGAVEMVQRRPALGREGGAA
jgi:hypothetical protein